MTADDVRRVELSKLLGTVIAVDEEDSVVTLTYADGRRVCVTGSGYSGMWEDVLIYESDINDAEDAK